MSDEPQHPAAPHPDRTHRRWLAGAIAGSAVLLSAVVAFLLTGFEWLDAFGLGAMFGVPVFFSVVRWQTAADFCLGLIESAATVLGVVVAALAAILSALAS